MNIEEIVRVPYTTHPNFERYQGPAFEDPPSLAHMAAKKAMFEDDRIYGQSWFETSVSIENDLPNKVAERLGRHKRCRVELGRDVSSVKDLALLVQEDVAILHRGKMEACCFLFPSGWAPECKVGMTFAELHRPVADSERLQAAANNITALMCGEHSYHRFVWGLAGSGMLSAHPRYKDKIGDPKSIADIWFRYEHQITVPIEPGMTSLFTVNVQVVPYLELSEGHRERVLESIRSMSPKIFTYKGMGPFRKVLDPG